VGFAELSMVSAVALLGPLLALPRAWHLPVILGELAAGVVLGRTGFGWLDATDPTFTFLGEIGFALVMFVAGTHVPVRNPAMRRALRPGVLRALGVGALAIVGAVVLTRALDVPHAPLYAVLMASSSAAVIMPVISSLGLGGDDVLGLLPQVAIADAVCIVALPLAIDPAHVGRAAIGAGLVLLAALVLFLTLAWLERTGLRTRVHDISEDREFALELRIQLSLLFALAAIAVASHVSIMLAGFAFGLGVSAVGEPRRLAKQLFAVTEGFLGPVYFVWLGAGLNVRDLGTHPRMIVLGVALAVGAALVHGATVLARQPFPLGMLAAAQLGVPVAATTVGTQLGVLLPGEGAGLMLGALLTIAIAVAGGSLAVRRGLLATPSGHPHG
jgi:Kef-type K+ transport system membrane component KefB